MNTRSRIVLLIAASLAAPALAQVSVENVEFQNAGARLAGIVAAPSSGRVLAGVVLVPGSGREPRMRAFAAAFAAQGVVALTYDKRGVGESTGTYVGPEVGTNDVDRQHLDRLAGDAAAGLRHLAGLPNMRGKPLGLVGISQAGWIIPLAAGKTRECSFILFWSGPVTTVKEELAFSRIADGTPDFWRHHSAAEVKATILKSTADYRFEDTDPRQALRRLRIPGLWLFGDNDTSIPVDLSIERLKDLDAERARTFEYRVIAGSGHHLPFAEAFPISLEWIQRVSSDPSRGKSDR